MHVSPAKLWQTDRQTTDKVIPMCPYASQATQKVKIKVKSEGHISLEVIKVYYAHLSIVSIPCILTTTIKIKLKRKS